MKKGRGGGGGKNVGGLTGQKKLNATRIGSMDGDVKLDFFFFFFFWLVVMGRPFRG